MDVRESVSLRALTTLKVGGTARYVIECASIEDIREGVAFARACGLPFRPLGQGSNVLALESGYDGVVLHIRIPGIAFEASGDTVTATIGAGITWDVLVDVAAARGLWGLENLAGIPGTVGAAPVQNIGAYGAEVADTLSAVEVYDPEQDAIHIYRNEECRFGYRDSRFKQERHLIITKVTFTLLANGTPRTHYPDLEARKADGASLETPSDIARVVREVRSRKFPDLTQYGTAGSFFKNPILSQDAFAQLEARYRAIPRYEVAGGTKVPLAWILDHVLALRNFAMGPVSLFERQPLVLVTNEGASAHDVEALATHVASLVRDATGIDIEREVQTFV